MTESFTEGRQEVPEAGDLEQTVWEDYWGTNETQRFYMPDRKQWIEYKLMVEGDRAKYQRDSGVSMTLQRTTGDTKLQMDSAKEREALLKNSVIGWNLHKQQTLIPFNSHALQEWIAVAPPQILDDLIHRIRMFNPFLTEDMTVEQIDKEMERLQEMREVAKRREEEKESSANK